MKIQQKIDILTQSFEVLKSNIENNTSDLSEISSIIEQMFVLDEDSALMMWEYALANYTHYSRWNGNATYYITSSLLSTYENRFGIDKLLSMLEIHPIIKHNVFSESYCIDYFFFITLINTNKLYEFSEYYSIVEKNDNFLNCDDHDDSRGEMLEYISGMIDGASDDGIALLLQKANEVSEKSKAIVNVNLLKYM